MKEGKQEGKRESRKEGGKQHCFLLKRFVFIESLDFKNWISEDAIILVK